MNHLNHLSYFAQFQEAEKKISASHGEFALFGLFERSDVFGKFDVLVSAKWLDRDRASMNLIVDLVREAIGNDQWWSKIAKFLILPEDDPFVQAVQEAMPDGSVQHDLKILTHFYYDGDIIRSAAIITAQKYPVEHMASVA